MGATAPRKTVLDRNRVITEKIVSNREYTKRKQSPKTHRTAALLGIDGFETLDGKAGEKGVKVYVLKQAEQAWAETTKHQTENAERENLEEQAALGFEFNS